MALDKVQLFSSTPFIPLGSVSNKVVSPLETLRGTYLCNDFTLNSGTTCYIRDTVYIMARGDVVINGFMNGMGDTTAALPPMEYAYLGNTWTSTVVSRTDLFGNYGNYPGSGIAGGTTALGGLAHEAIVNLRGSGGASGYMAFTSTTLPSPAGHYASGGLAGKTIIIRALGSIQIGSSGVINCAGGWAQNWNSQFPFPAELLYSGAGGGSGGVIVLDADGDCTNSGGLYAVGGKGSNGLNGTYGGGGGGGGIIIVQSRYETSTVGTTLVTQGIAGESSGISLGSGGGGGCGGFGGNGGHGRGPGNANGFAPVNGELGIVRQWGTPW